MLGFRRKSKSREYRIIYSVRNKNIQIASGIRTSFQIDQRRFLKQMAFRLGPEGGQAECLLVNFVTGHVTVSRKYQNQNDALVEGEGHVWETELVDILSKRI